MQFPIPNLVNKELFRNNRSVANTNIAREDTWHYVEFLFESLETPRNKTEALIKKRYQYAYLQFKNLKLSAKQYVSCGRHKQVFLLLDTVPHRVIKIFHSYGDWILEKNQYEKLQKLIPDSLLPHEYREGYAICDCVEMLNSTEMTWAKNNTVNIVKKIVRENLLNKNNRSDLKRMLNLKLIKNNDGCNLGLWQDRLVWIDVGDSYGRLNRWS